MWISIFPSKYCVHLQQPRGLRKMSRPLNLKVICYFETSGYVAGKKMLNHTVVKTFNTRPNNVNKGLNFIK